LEKKIMSTPFIAEIRMVSFAFAPKGWALCNGQLLPINQNQAMFSLVGTTFGGDGVTTFGLPDYRGRVPIGVGQQSGTPSFKWGQRGGEEMHTLLTGELPLHTHSATASTVGVGGATPSNNFWPNGVALYSNNPIDTRLATQAIANNGSSQPHENRSPYSVINFIIALTGMFPSRN
jgi:microcystin-dependent protein